MALPPLKYCTIERAAKLLNCEMWDIYYWWQIGYIELNIMVDHVNVIALFRFNHKPYLKYCRRLGRATIKKINNQLYDEDKTLRLTNIDKNFECILNEMYGRNKNVSDVLPKSIEMNYSFFGHSVASGLLTFTARTKFPVFNEYMDFRLFDSDVDILFIPHNFNDENKELLINLEFETDLLREIHISNLIISGEDLAYLQNFDNSLPRKINDYPNLDLTASFRKVGQKSHPLKDKIITIARDTKNYYLEKDIDLGLKVIATKIKKHNDFSNKGLPSPEQMARWFVSDGIDASKTTRTFDFELIF